MNRKEFLRNLGIGVAGLAVLNSIPACNNRDNVPRVDFTIDLTDPQYQVLNSTGGQVVVNTILIAKGISGFLAVSSICTHAQCTVQYQAFSNEYNCPCHGSKFDTKGGVLMGPASSPLQQYQTQLNGNSLRIYTP